MGPTHSIIIFVFIAIWMIMYTPKVVVNYYLFKKGDTWLSVYIWLYTAWGVVNLFF